MTTSEHPTTGTVTVQGSQEFTVAADDDGSYSISVPPGTYTVTGTSPLYNDGEGICRADSPATVTNGASTSVEVLCQMK